MVGSGDGNGVHVLLLEDLAKVLVAGRSIAQFMFRDACKLCQNLAIHVADMGDTGGILVCHER